MQHGKNENFSFQGASRYDGEDPWTLPWLVSPQQIITMSGLTPYTWKLILLSWTFCWQDVSKNEDEILPSWQTCVGWAQLCGQICQRKLQIAQGASLHWCFHWSLIMIAEVQALILRVPKIPALMIMLIEVPVVINTCAKVPISCCHVCSSTNIDKYVCRSTSNLTKRSTSSSLLWSKPCSLMIRPRG